MYFLLRPGGFKRVQLYKMGEGLDEDDFVPKCYEGKPQEKSQRSPKFRHQGRQGVDKMFCLDGRFPRRRPKGECELFRLKDGLTLLSDEIVLSVLARFPTLGELFQLLVFSKC